MLEKNVVELADQLEVALKDVAPEAIEAAGRAIFMAGLMNLLVTLAVGVALICLGRHAQKHWLPKTDACDRFLAWLGIACAYIGGITAIVTGWGSVYNWLAVLDQKAWLALKLLDKFGN